MVKIADDDGKVRNAPETAMARSAGSRAMMVASRPEDLRHSVSVRTSIVRARIDGAIRRGRQRGIAEHKEHVGAGPLAGTAAASSTHADVAEHITIAGMTSGGA
jgi:hypothetical protein